MMIFSVDRLLIFLKRGVHLRFDDIQASIDATLAKFLDVQTSPFSVDLIVFLSTCLFVHLSVYLLVTSLSVAVSPSPPPADEC